ncbi:MAG: hypothetical protein ACKN82_15610, partial [Pirellula sp.]
MSANNTVNAVRNLLPQGGFACDKKTSDSAKIGAQPRLPKVFPEAISKNFLGSAKNRAQLR